VFDLGVAWLGHTFVEITAPSGTIVDIGNAEFLRPDGMIEMYGSHWGVNNADRFTCRGGRQRFESFHHRGGRYLQVSVRGSNAPVTLHRVGVRETVLPFELAGAFESSDPVFTWAFRAGVATMVPTMGDAFVDPWRERGVYIGDTLVEFHAARAMHADAALTRRCLKVWADGQRPDGQMFDVAPAWKEHPLADYTLIWVLILRDYWAATGDVAFVKSVWPCIDRIFASPLWKPAASGLWIAGEAYPFCDWGIERENRTGESSVLNAFRVGARDAAAELAQVLGRPREAAAHRKEAAAGRRAFQSLWREDLGRYAANEAAKPSVRNLHGNALALLFNIAPPAREKLLLPWFLQELAHNTDHPKGRMEPYYLYFVCEALFARGLVAEAEHAIREHWGRMQHPPERNDLGSFGPIHAPAHTLTLWETLNRHGSQCHGWACTPQHVFATRTLGVRNVPGKPDSITIEPDSATLAWASGSVPHRRGTIHVAWERQGSILDVRIRLPGGVKAEVRPGKSFANLTARLSILPS
jgi:hypothetical protein